MSFKMIEETEVRIPLAEAEKVAMKYYEMFKPLCDKIKIAGSIRRRKSEVKDIELVCFPKTIQAQTSFFEIEQIRNPQFIALVNSFERVKGNGSGKYSQLILEEGMKLDLFIANPENFGIILLIRTGSANFNKRIVEEIKPKHFLEGGYLRSAGGAVVPVPTEECFFKITGIQYLKPVARIY